MANTVEGGEAGEGQGPEAVCPQCGLTRANLYQDGHMGCAGCYEVFEGEVLHALWRIHGAVDHIGKA
ncbi:MAG: hypothetical protein JWQ02_1655 [Capsulimonas sp.]|jgi:protein-arginine kinase activator protein McsA|nr:hypothetical protein [Capsulimonas sp.]